MNCYVKKTNALVLAFGVTLSLTIMPVSASEMAGMKMTDSNTMTETTGYQFKLAGPPKSAGDGKSIVAVNLLHKGKPVSGAIIIQSRADMGPMGMASMTAPIRLLGEQPPGTYRFEIRNGPVWKKPDNWAVRLGAKVQGVTKTVTGSVTVKLQP